MSLHLRREGSALKGKHNPRCQTPQEKTLPSGRGVVAGNTLSQLRRQLWGWWELRKGVQSDELVGGWAVLERGGGREWNLGFHCFIAVDLVPAGPSACPWCPHTPGLRPRMVSGGLGAEQRDLSGLPKVNPGPLAPMTHV